MIVKITNQEDTEPAKDVKISVVVKGGDLTGPGTHECPEEIDAGQEAEVGDLWSVRGDEVVEIIVTVTGTFIETPDSGKSVLKTTVALSGEEFDEARCYNPNCVGPYCTCLTKF